MTALNPLANNQPLDPFGRQVLTPSGLCSQVQNCFDEELGSIWLAGEVSDFKIAASGHWYLSLKDQRALIKGVVWKKRQSYLPARPKEGWLVLVRGRLDLYAPRGDFQLVIDYLEPLGEGALRLAFEELKEKLKNEGLFEAERKRKLPFWPRKVALITSPAGAVVMDFIRIAQRRRPNLHLSIYPVKVQGFEAAEGITQALNDINQWGGFDLIVMARGGGSLEDLWPFNDETLARAISNSQIPVVSAIGHETDFTIADFVADLRAPTPSAAAELIYRSQADIEHHLNQTAKRFGLALNRQYANLKQRLNYLENSLNNYPKKINGLREKLKAQEHILIRALERNISAKDLKLKKMKANLYLINPKARLATHQARLYALKQALIAASLGKIKTSRWRLSGWEQKLTLLSPLNVLNRGYALVTKGPQPGGQVVRSAAELNSGDLLTIRLAKGLSRVRVEEN